MGPRGQAEAVLLCIFLEARPLLDTSQPVFLLEGARCLHARGARLPRSPARSRTLAGGRCSSVSLGDSVAWVLMQPFLFCSLLLCLQEPMQLLHYVEHT